MKPIRSMIPAAFVLTALAVGSTDARAQGFFYGQGVTGYSYSGYGSSYGSYGYGGFGPSFYGQGLTTGGLYGSPYGGYYGGASMYYGQSLPYGPLPMQNPAVYGVDRRGAVGGVVPYIPRLDATLPQLSPRVPTLR